jgi:hypothetical protein
MAQRWGEHGLVHRGERWCEQSAERAARTSTALVVGKELAPDVTR